MFYALKNLSASTVTPLERPWADGPKTPGKFDSKEAYQAWCFDPTTEHAFISGIEGVTPSLRLSGTTDRDGGNPAFKMCAAIVDYDAAQDVDERVRLAVTKPAGEHLPAYFYSTLRHMRGVWIFEAPVLLPPNPQVVKKFLSILSKKLQLRKWAAGYEEEAFVQANKYYAMHGPWKPVKPTAVVPKDLLHLWLFQACEAFRLAVREPIIPLEVVREEVERRWPGRWAGPFELGARGVRFWDPTAADATVCKVHQDGMVVFNGDPKPFMTWGDIFGMSFLERFEADKLAPIKEKTVYDVEGEKFYLLADDGTWMPRAKGDFAQMLRVKGFDGHIPRGQTCSAIDRCEQQIKCHQAVFGARPFVYKPSGVIIHQGKPVLNTSRCRPIAPAPPGDLFTLADFRKKCPNLWEYLTTLFNDPEDAAIPQMLWFLGWLKLFYTGALCQEPQSGQILVLAGPPSAGKTFMTDVVLAGLMGGVADASEHIVQGSQWTDFLEYGIAKVDDAVQQDDPKAHARFSETLKALAANPLRNINSKYQKVAQVVWLGRVVVNMNDDPRSLRMLPSLEISAATKFAFLRVKKPSTKFRDHKTNQLRFLPELPLLARFLIEWEYPEMLLDKKDTRYLLVPYHHPYLKNESASIGSTYALYELLEVWAKAYLKTMEDKVDEGAHGPEWKGTTTELYTMMSSLESLRPLVGKYTTHSMGLGLRSLASQGLITKVKAYGNKVVWRVLLAQFMDDGGETLAGSFVAPSLGLSPDMQAYVEKKALLTRATDAVAEEAEQEVAEDERRNEQLHPGILSALCDQAPGEGAGEEAGDQGGVSGSLLAGAGGDGGSGGRADLGGSDAGGEGAAGAEDVGGGPGSEDQPAGIDS